MLQLTPHHRLLLAPEAVDFRRGIDGLAALCRQQLMHDPFSGTVFAFTNKRRTAVKILVYDGNGFWLCQKRFSQGKLTWWPRDQSEASSIRPVELAIILQQGNPKTITVADDWKPLK